MRPKENATPDPARRRAPGMSQERRREMIVMAALPLVAEYGAAVTTAQIARAAGIGEATVFRAFTDKEELLDACVVEVLRPDHVLEQLASVPLDQPLTERLTEAAEAMRAHMARIGTVLGALHASGRRSRGSRTQEEGAGAPSDRAASFKATRDALTELFEPEGDRLRLPPERLAALFLSLTFAGARGSAADVEPSVAEIVDVFVHGILN
ncbi:TetR/AcrR family transcriptional regulator [Streptosporangium sp. NPDC000239]|uniref:TetR/AcrR family transcriptional regulator n=1 Tax=Streptosporangium jomthongense TaxID=1193683 RepID=A0ABV8F7M3_9ACTN